jgi:CHAD domain-containing protein
LAILTLVEPVLDPKQFVKTSRLLRRIARTARPVRDLDTVLHRIEEWPASKPLDQWTRSLRKERACEAESLCRAIDGWLEGKKIRRRARRLVRHSKCLAAETAPRPGEPPFPVWVAQRWLVWVDEQCNHAPCVEDSHALHAFRLSGKQIRYAMEYLLSMFAKPYRGQLQLRLRKRQEQLGEINDLSALVAKLKIKAEAADCLRTAAVWDGYLRLSQKELQHLQRRAAKRLTPESLLEFRNLCREALRESLGATP